MNNLLDLLTQKEKKTVIYKKLDKGEILFLEDATCNSIGVIIDGQIDIVSYSFSGKEMIYNSLKKNDVFGNNLLFSDSPKYKGNVISKDKSLVGLINKENLLTILMNNDKFLIEYLKIQSNFGKSLNAQIKLLSLDNALDRFQYYLFSNNNEVHYKNVASLAKSLHLERETLSRLLSKLEKEGVIYRDKHLIKYL